MKKLAMLVGVLALVVIGLGPFAYVVGRISLDAFKWAALVSTVVWFVAVMWPDGREGLGEVEGLRESRGSS